MLVLDWKERAFKEKVNSRCFCCFLAAILVHQNGTPICRLQTKLYKGVWNASANNSETMGHKDLRLVQIVYILSFITLHFLSFFHRRVSNLIFCCVTVKTIYTQYTHLVAQVSSTQHYIIELISGAPNEDFTNTLKALFRLHRVLLDSYWYFL